MKRTLSVPDGSFLHYQVNGTGKVVLFLHGNSQNHSYFIWQKRLFNRFFRSVWLDTRDHGLSTNTQTTLTFQQIVSDIVALLKQEGWRKLSIVGFSDGANIALLFAKKYPQFVEKLVLVSPNLSPNGLKTVKRKQMKTLLKWFSKLRLKKFQRRTALALSQTGISEEDLRQLAVPTLLVQGENDIISHQHIAAIAKALPNSQLEMVSNTGHSVPFLRPKWFNQKVLSFLTEKKNSKKVRP